jgi:hypothetical protein
MTYQTESVNKLLIGTDSALQQGDKNKTLRRLGA